jgi:ribosomal protein S18 acetylase RimI-like enzyme
VAEGDQRFLIVQSGWRDLSSLIRLENECFGEDAWPWWDLLGVLAFSENIRLKAITSNEMMAGFVAGDVKRVEKTGWVTTLGVKPRFRRQGMARALLLACEEQMGMPRVCLCVRCTNQPAVSLYERNGYHRISTWRSYYPDGEDAFVLEKRRKID